MEEVYTIRFTFFDTKLKKKIILLDTRLLEP